MLIFKLISKLYTSKDSKWINDIDEKKVEPFVVQRWLCMNQKVSKETRYLDQFVFHLKPKQYLSLAWAILPKTEKSPFVRYIKKEVTKDNLDFLMVKIREYFKMSDNDWNINKDNIRKLLDEDLASWFKFFGVRKYYWKKFGIDFNKIKLTDYVEA